MKCEICNTIERLGLDPSAHDLWYCVDSKCPRIRLAMIGIHRRRRHFAALSLRRKFRRAFHALSASLPAHRQHYVTLCLR